MSYRRRFIDYIDLSLNGRSSRLLVVSNGDRTQRKNILSRSTKQSLPLETSLIIRHHQKPKDRLTSYKVAMLLQTDIQIQSPGDAQLLDNLPIPDLRDAYVKSKVIVVAVAPSDWRHTHHSARRSVR